MFTGFFYLLRAHGFRVSLNEWMTLIEGLMLDLQHDSLTGFYELCRAVLVKSEADYDKFDQRIEGCEYRRLRKYTLEEALNSMKERLGILEEKGEAGE
jgi:uncharacterized protein with von Willebrand factor type A (vWA) domain